MERKTHQSFNEDLHRGKHLEHEVHDYLIKKDYPESYVTVGKVKGYDIVIPEIQETVEVKGDEQSCYTGNFLVEIEYDGIPSGLSTTTSDWWIIVDKDNYYVLKTESMRYLVTEWGKNRKPPNFVGNGDIKSKKAWLIPKSKIAYSFYTRILPRKESNSLCEKNRENREKEYTSEPGTQEDIFEQGYIEM